MLSLKMSIFVLIEFFVISLLDNQVVHSLQASSARIIRKKIKGKDTNGGSSSKKNKQNSKKEK